MTDDVKTKPELNEDGEEILPPPETTTILVEDTPSLKRLLTLNLELYTATTVINKCNADDLIEFIKRNNKVNLIICKNMVGEENTILKVYYYVNSNKLDIPIILLGENSKLKGEVHPLDPYNWKEIVKTSAKLLNIKPENMVKHEVPDYYPIQTKTLSLLDKSPIEIYKQTIDGGFETLYQQGDEINHRELKDMALRGDYFIYVHKNSRLKFAQYFSSDVQALLSTEMSDNDRVYATGASFSYSRNLIATSGLTEKAVEMAEATIGSMIKISESSKELSRLLELLSQTEEGYLYKHSVMIAVVGSNVISKIDWGGKPQRESMCFMAFFHDITLPDDDLCQIQSDAALEEAELSEEMKKRVQKHALHAKELISSYPNVPFGAESFILQHHGVKTGVGFTENHTDPNISPMAIVFKIVEEYVDALINPQKGGFNKEDYIHNQKKIYNTGQHKKAILALEEVICPNVPKS